MRLKLSEIASRVGGNLFGEDREISSLSIDSRATTESSLFCAVVGARADGHDFIEDAMRSGSVAALVTRKIATTAPLVIVDSVESALELLAKSIRREFLGAPFGITGSVGKTSTKELLATALGDEGSVLKSKGNLNTEYGVPMTWMDLQPAHEFAVIEMGARGIGHIRHLCEMSQPSIGIITSIGTAHIGELGSRAGILQAKAELFESLPENGAAIAPHGTVAEELSGYAKCEMFTFGLQPGADVSVTSVEFNVLNNTTIAGMSVFGEFVKLEIPALGRHQAANAAAAVAACQAAGVDLKKAVSRMAAAEVPRDRLRSVPYNKAIVLVDVYNSSPESCMEALHVLTCSPATGKRIAVLGDMKELGAFSHQLHSEVGLAAASSCDKVVAIGDFAEAVVAGAKEADASFDARAYSSIDAAVAVLKSAEPGDVILIKGSRTLQLEDALAEADVVVA